MNLGRVLRDRRHARLLHAARRGDGEAFRMLYRELYPTVTGYLAARLVSREDAEDLTSIAFHRFLEHLDRFDASRGSVMTWLLSLAHHALVDHWRRARPQAPESAIPHANGDDSEGPLERMIREERAEDVRRAIERLEPETRRMFRLRYDIGLSHGEIARLLAVREDAIKQRFSRAHRKLRAALDREGGSGHGA